MKEISYTKMTTISGAGADIEQFKPLPGTDAPTTGDAPFIPGKPGYKENDIPGNILNIECTK
ncbi:hypothetical protein ZQ34_005286 [Salmonella enterica subsp. salamae]|uniref:Uncharacterized protein n=1 Tax=Salmonella enterica subsp. enterica serovar Macclesfield str. S-1643 TaxID=1242107 RepID=A0A241PXA6_SALET|nr:hypothetical protein [Salmonella enterica]EAA5488831.1 hypothetical protein [Salmonella enterica subsp. enterica serovar Kouka]EBG2396895.1 hypothetical protein [Salmonella enterica subsp. enterica serovar Everleigh]ECE5745824.1 hypothetical protein [Salmonella enterica subsp. salamae]HCM1965144.1 hypothetical protein [Salmonella enterica subsp. salamae serovar 56:l,v:z39]ASG19105.1 hypothetical protein LFZ25_24970 [Salmonella enterica subsp. enterica serovar Macclesfield str. S-1643]